MSPSSPLQLSPARLAPCSLSLSRPKPTITIAPVMASSSVPALRIIPPTPLLAAPLSPLLPLLPAFDLPDSPPRTPEREKEKRELTGLFLSKALGSSSSTLDSPDTPRSPPLPTPPSFPFAPKRCASTNFASPPHALMSRSTSRTPPPTPRRSVVKLVDEWRAEDSQPGKDMAGEEKHEKMSLWDVLKRRASAPDMAGGGSMVRMGVGRR